MDVTIAAALGDPVRRDIVEMLRHRPLPAGEIARAFDISRPAVSRHLRVLRDSGIVSQEAVGRERVYRLRPGPLRELHAWLGEMVGTWDNALDALATEVHRTRRERRTTDRDHERADQSQTG